MVTAGRSYFNTLQNACVTTGKTTMAAGKIYHSCFEMLSWPHRTSANIINMCFWLLETCTKCLYFIRKNIRPDAQRLAFEVKYEYRSPDTYIFAIGNPERHVRKASHRGSKQQQRSRVAISLRVC